MGVGILPGERASGRRASQWESQSAVTVVADVRPGGVDAVRGLLAEMSADVAANRIVPFGEIPGTHFARFFVTDEVTTPRGLPIPAHLVFMSDIDGAPAGHLERLAQLPGQGFDELFGLCTGYPPDRPASHAQRLAFLTRHLAADGVGYINTIGRSVQRVLAEAELYESIGDALDGRRDALRGVHPLSARRAVIDFVRGRPGLCWALTPAPARPFHTGLGEAARFVAPVLAGVAAAPVVVPALVAWLLVLRAHESRDAAPRLRPSPAHLAALRALEDHAAQNQFTALGFVKPGRLRAVTAHAVLTLTGFGARHIFNNGNLAGVKTIHFARWVPLDDRARILFCSNFDGSTESYMDDFIDKVAWGLNAVFSNGVGYPATRWLIRGGARHEEAFKGFLRTRQVPTQVWYSAYAGLTALNISIHARVRAGLSGDMSAREAQAWLRLL